MEGGRKQVVGRRRKQAEARRKARRAERVAAPCPVQAGGRRDAYRAGKA